MVISTLETSNLTRSPMSNLCPNHSVSVILSQSRTVFLLPLELCEWFNLFYAWSNWLGEQLSNGLDNVYGTPTEPLLSQENSAFVNIH